MFVNIVYIPKPLISNISLPLFPLPSSISLQTSAFRLPPSLTVPPNAETRSLLDEP